MDVELKLRKVNSHLREAAVPGWEKMQQDTGGMKLRQALISGEIYFSTRLNQSF